MAKSQTHSHKKEYKRKTDVNFRLIPQQFQRNFIKNISAPIRAEILFFSIENSQKKIHFHRLS